MKMQSKHTTGSLGILMSIIIFLGLSVGWVQAQDIKINTRPLTPQEIKDYALAVDTQVANGTHVVGLGQPVYLELLVETGTVVTQVVWTLDAVVDEDGDPLASSATITNSPIGMVMPTFDAGDREDFDVIDRAMIVPDMKGTYQISVQAATSNSTLNANLDVVGSVFIGKDHYLCVLCHATKQAPFNMTDHSQAFKNQITGEGSSHFASYCIKCHVTGYDSAPGAVNGGFDDVANDIGWTFPETLSSNNWDDMPIELQAKSNIQCENCHGPADEHVQTLGDTSKIAISISAGNCGQCHDSLTHHVKVSEWKNTGHAQGYVFRSSGSCAKCHSTKGFIDANDPGVNELGEIVATKGTGNEGITCAACHDPHSPGAGAHQLRNIESVTLENGHVITDGGDGLICMSCHKTRRYADEYVLGNPSSYFGPHYGVPGDMISGENAIEYGQNMPSSKHLTAVENSCVGCHMQDSQSDLGGHTFMLASHDDGTNAVVRLTQACSTCHGEVDDFDFGGEDLNRDGFIEGVQTEIHHLMDELALILPPYGSTSVNVSDLATVQLRKAGYNYKYVYYDGSYGVHNPKYSAAILRASIDDLMGGIDIDRDGLVDSWEIENFGDLTSQSGADDYDGDGLNNIEEYNLGTNALLVDSDGDGFSDLVEVQGNSDPLEITSVPTEDLVLIPAAELAYLPKGTNSTVHFQSIDSLTDGTWTNIGPEQISSGDWLFQLESMRTNGNNRFFRAIEE